MTLPTYSTGTVAVAAGGTVVTNAGGMWTGINVKQGDFISIAGSTAVLITEVTDASHLKIAPWPGAAQTAAAYVIYQNYVGRVVGVAAAEDVAEMLERLNDQAPIFNVPTGETAPDPSYGADGQWAHQISTGQWWVKSGGVWVPSGAPAGVSEAPNDGKLYGRQSLAWHEALPSIGGTISGDLTVTGKITSPGIREKLTVARTYYVSTTGNDANDGLTVGTPFKTLQRAWNVVDGTIDFNGMVVTIKVADGVYTDGITAGNEAQVGLGSPSGLMIEGNLTTPGNVVISVNKPGQGAFEWGLGEVVEAKCTLRGMKITNSASGGSGIRIWGPACYVRFDLIDFGYCHIAHISVHHGAIATALTGHITISGGAYYHWLLETGGQLYFDNAVFTIVGSPTINIWGSATDLGQVMAQAASYSGSPATGCQKYLVVRNANIFTGGGVLPGSVAGQAAAGGQYS
jgi:hypothetical protein